MLGIWQLMVDHLNVKWLLTRYYPRPTIKLEPSSGTDKAMLPVLDNLNDAIERLNMHLSNLQIDFPVKDCISFVLPLFDVFTPLADNPSPQQPLCRQILTQLQYAMTGPESENVVEYLYCYLSLHFSPHHSSYPVAGLRSTAGG